MGRIRIVYPTSPANLIKRKNQTVEEKRTKELHSYMVFGHKGEIVVELTQSVAGENMMGGPRIQGWACRSNDSRTFRHTTCIGSVWCG